MKRTPLRKVMGIVASIAFALTMFAAFAATDASASGYKMSQAAAASQLSGAGIGWWSSGNCTNRYNSSCTSFEQINSGTVNQIIAFHQMSGCPITITGGTEVGHASGTYSHWNGYKVDVSPNSCISNYVYSHMTYIGLRSDGYRMYRSNAGNIYTYEGSHWDIVYY